MSKLEAGAVDLSEDMIDIDDLASGAVRFISPVADDDGVQVTTAIPEGLPRLRGDATEVRQILLNLLSNAVKFTPRGGQDELRAVFKSSGELILEVEDTDIGIAPEDIERVVTPFAQMENQEHLQRAENPKSDGGHTSTGLGLPLVKLLSEIHGAQFSITSAPEQGTTATVVFPARRVVAVPPGNSVKERRRAAS